MKLLLVPILLATSAVSAQTVDLATAGSHPIRYYLSLPQGWTAGKKWPVVIVIESANRNFQKTAELFARARGSMPFILATPMVVTNGGPSYRQVPNYRYSDTEWERIEKEGGCRFDQEGIAAVSADVQKRYGGEEKYFLTGWEAGGHTVWAAIFQHPESMRAAAPVDSNFANRCLDGGFSSSAARSSLPIRVFLSALDIEVAPNRYVTLQSGQAKALAEQHGFGPVSQQMVAKPHGPMPEEVLAWFLSLL